MNGNMETWTMITQLLVLQCTKFMVFHSSHILSLIYLLSFIISSSIVTCSSNMLPAKCLIYCQVHTLEKKNVWSSVLDFNLLSWHHHKKMFRHCLFKETWTLTDIGYKSKATKSKSNPTKYSQLHELQDVIVLYQKNTRHIRGKKF